MSYKLKVNSKNQITLPVEMLISLGLEPGVENETIIYQNQNGEWILCTQEILDKKIASSIPKSGLQELLESDYHKNFKPSKEIMEYKDFKEYYKENYKPKAGQDSRL